MGTPLEKVAKKKEAALKKLNDKGYNRPKKVFVGMATCEIAAGSKDVMEVFEEAMKKGLKDVYLSQKGYRAGAIWSQPWKLLKKARYLSNTARLTKKGPKRYCPGI